MRNVITVLVTVWLISLGWGAGEAQAYIGPGAGFAFLGSAFVFLLTFVMAFVTIAFWPLQSVWRLVAGKRISKNARTRRVVIVGLDGLEPKLVERYLQEGKLPNLKRLKEEGSYSLLGTTLPPLSPVAWSTFQTGVNPGAHNVFDFLTRDKRYCLPDLSSTKTEPPRRMLKLGKFVFPLSKAKITLLRKSQPFWKILGQYGIFSNIIRVPISYPPEEFNGNILSAMCTPDLKGTQGKFCAYTTNRAAAADKHISGDFIEVQRLGQEVQAFLEGPPNPFRVKAEPLRIPFTVKLQPELKQAVIEIGKEKVVLKQGKFSDWVEVKFKFGLTKSVSGICRFCLRSIDPEFFLYVSPININPAKPALPISHPLYFSTYLAKTQGLYGTLGLMEDTWGRNEFALNDEDFLNQTYLTHEEREKMFFDALQKTREGVCCCVFDASDRIQHMFWRYIDDKHPAPREDRKESHEAIADMYAKMDDLVGRVHARIRPEDVLIVLSDHGFTSYRRGINLNAWLRDQGYLVVKPGANEQDDYFQYVDWSKTKAFAVGLNGIYINRKGREYRGIVEPAEAERLKAEIRAKLVTLTDPQDGSKVVRKVYDTATSYHGLYKDNAADLLLGCEPGYRISWESVTGGISPEVFSDNLKAWSGDHDVDPEAVPGVLFSNWDIKVDNPNIVDLAPTVLNLFDVKIPRYMEGQVVL